MHYIVTRLGRPLVLGRYEHDSACPREGVLLFGEGVSAFQSRRRAVAAIRRSWEYACRNHLDWDQHRTGAWRICHLEPAAASRDGTVIHGCRHGR